MPNNLRKYRDEKNLSQEQVGEVLGVSHTTVGRHETGEISATISDLERYGILYGCTPAELVARPDERVVRVGGSTETAEVPTGPPLGSSPEGGRQSGFPLEKVKPAVSQTGLRRGKRPR